jgi:hypothetical protein
MTDPRSDITSKLGTSGWHLSLERASADGEPYLGDFETVVGIVRAFVAGICDRYAEVCDGTRLAMDAAAADRAECLRLGTAFAGQDPAYRTVGVWNGQPAADFARATMPDYLPDGGTPAEVLGQAMAVLAHRVYEVLSAYAENADDETARMSLDGAADDWTRLLMGLPPSGESEPDPPQD